MNISKAVKIVKNNLGKDIYGKCYIASEAVYHLCGGKNSNLKPMCLRIKHKEFKTHWFLLNKKSNKIIDITSSQFSKPPKYSDAVGKGFLTKFPSKKAKLLMK